MNERVSFMAMMRALLGAVVAAGSLALVLSGCPSSTDLGQPCVLVRKDPNDPSRSIPLKEREIVVGKDFISFGAVECEDLVCVRDARAEKGPDEAEAQGFCSKPCVQTNQATCNTGNRSVDEGPDAYACRALILDEQTLAAIRTADPERYQQYFGDTQSPYFCAKGDESADAGT